MWKASAVFLALFGAVFGRGASPKVPPPAVSAADSEHEARLVAYLARSFPDTLSAVAADGDRVKIEGSTRGNGQGVQLAEVPMWEDVTALKSPPTLISLDGSSTGQFSKVVPRHDVDGRDRLLSGWALVRKSKDAFQLLSSVRYVDSITPRADLPAIRPRSIKGLCGCPFDSPDMQELGVASVTRNIVLNGVIHSEPAPGRTEYAYAGRTWYTADREVARLDRDMKTAFDHGWMVSVIILIAPVRNAPPGAWVRAAAHPDADPRGAYVMPNFTTRAGVEAYSAAMNFLAERYSRPDGKLGRIHHWILHNEVNSGFYWTTAGARSLITYLDLYQKSLRLTWLLARQYDPHARPFISLDHHWSRNPDPRGYSAREMLERLLTFSRNEGDFDWGIAFHPYAQDLRNPRTWEDSQATFAYDTPMVTFKNIEVIDAWVRQRRTGCRGIPREVQLTEQGLNSPDYGEKSLTEQAAGLAYAWEKIEPLKTITAFQYHHWADAREEGGLRLGLRKFSDDPADPLGKKPAWSVFQAMGTPGWDAASAFAKPLIGIRDWDEVRHRDPVR